MRHVHEQIRAYAIGNRTETLPIYHQRVSRRACHDHLGLVLRCQRLHLIVVNLFLVIQAVLNGVVQLAADIHRCAVGQMATVRQRHTQNGIARFEYGSAMAA